MTKQETIQVLQSIEDRATDFPYMTACDWVAIAAAKRHLQEEPVSEELEKAALLYYPKMSRISEPHGIISADNQSHYLGDANEDNRKAFKAGAKWQKEQMMKGAITAQCFGFQGAALFSFRLPADNYLVGSELKVTIIKEVE